MTLKTKRTQTLEKKIYESGYLIKKGIPKERLIAKGYGETQVMEDCSGYSECPEAGEGDCPCHQNNRRTEFKIIGLKKDQ